MAVEDKGFESAGDGPRSSVANVGLAISNTDAVRKFLRSASSDPNLSDVIRELSSSLAGESSVPYVHLRRIWLGCEHCCRPSLPVLLAGSSFVFSSPKPREKSEELKIRLKKLEEAAERKAYQELVKDIAPKESVEEPFSSYKDQLGFGLHVVVTMFTGYLVGFAAFRALLGRSAAMSAAGGILGLVCAMLLETLLFIIRSSSLDRKPPRTRTTSSSLKMKTQ